ncbi:MAG: aspartyl/asparaginyl beta-hydroxylase domain-containing protein [Gammaproteobacteria bacterium]|nr:aspartyl/asparaginyl beta-hydroxylase domain-containing protein [Gammaproteobacteria bacterium]
MNGAMGRAVIVRLKPHGTIYPHTDDGLYWLLRDRYHLVLKSVKGSRFKAGGEETLMQEGELWWFDPTVPHEAFNDSDEDRIHIIVDIPSDLSGCAWCVPRCEVCWPLSGPPCEVCGPPLLGLWYGVWRGNSRRVSSLSSPFGCRWILCTRSRDTNVYPAHDAHPNDSGYTVVAQALANQLRLLGFKSRGDQID